MSDFWEMREGQAPSEREADFFRRLVPFLKEALGNAPGLARHLAGTDPPSSRPGKRSPGSRFCARIG